MSNFINLTKYLMAKYPTSKPNIKILNTFEVIERKNYPTKYTQKVMFYLSDT